MKILELEPRWMKRCPQCEGGNCWRYTGTLADADGIRFRCVCGAHLVTQAAVMRGSDDFTDLTILHPIEAECGWQMVIADGEIAA